MLWELGSEMREVYTWASVLLVCVQLWCVCVCVCKRTEVERMACTSRVIFSDHAPTKSLQRALVAFNFTPSLIQCFSSRADLSTWKVYKVWRFLRTKYIC